MHLQTRQGMKVSPNGAGVRGTGKVTPTPPLPLHCWEKACDLGYWGKGLRPEGSGAWQTGGRCLKSIGKQPFLVPLDQARLSPGSHSPSPEPAQGTGEEPIWRGTQSLFGHTETRANPVGSGVQSTANLCKPSPDRQSTLGPDGLRFKSQLCCLPAGWSGAADWTGTVSQFP